MGNCLRRITFGSTTSEASSASPVPPPPSYSTLDDSDRLPSDSSSEHARGSGQGGSDEGRAPRACTAEEVRAATDNFSAGRSLGHGIFGEMFRGRLQWAPDLESAQGAEGGQGAEGTAGMKGAEGTEGMKGAEGTAGVKGAEGTEGAKGAEGVECSEGRDNVAVRRFEYWYPLCVVQPMPDEEWMREAKQMLTRHHPSLVPLLGYCFSERVLVFPLYPNGSLSQALQLNNLIPSQDLQSKKLILSWSQRLAIATDCACALASLHADDILHQNMKPENILLDAHCRAYLTDFGLAKGHRHLERVMTQSETAHYMDVESLYLGQVTEKSDVYAFGVVLLEIIGGRRCCGKELRNWAEGEGAARSLPARIDRMINTADDEAQTALVLELAAACMSQDSSQRPDMSAVESALRDIQDLNVLSARNPL